MNSDEDLSRWLDPAPDAVPAEWFDFLQQITVVADPVERQWQDDI